MPQKKGLLKMINSEISRVASFSNLWEYLLVKLKLSVKINSFFCLKEKEEFATVDADYTGIISSQPSSGMQLPHLEICLYLKILDICSVTSKGCPPCEWSWTPAQEVLGEGSLGDVTSWLRCAGGHGSFSHARVAFITLQCFSSFFFFFLMAPGH